MKHLLFTLLFSTLFISQTFAQNTSALIEGYVFANDNSGYLRGAKITLLTATKTFRGEVTTDNLGKFEFIVDTKETYLLRVRLAGFNDQELLIDPAKEAKDGSIYLNVEMQRAPGYIFEATIAEWRPENSTVPVDAIEGATIEVYNKTEKKVVLELKNHTYHTFHFRMEQASKYVILIRKEGYFNKRIDANISIDGCILCIEGVGITRPGVADNLSDNNTTGTLGANIALKKINVNESIKVEHIYYDLGKFVIREDAASELDKLVAVLKENPNISIELSSHTDSRGEARSNLSLSQKRAEAAANYIISKGIISSRVTAKGYGESKLVNNCKDGVRCSEDAHQNNRRTEFKVTKIETKPAEYQTLEQMMEAEMFEEELEELMFQEVVQISEDGQIIGTDKLATKGKTTTKPSAKRTSLLDESKEEFVDNRSSSTLTKTRQEIKIRDPFAESKSTTKKVVTKEVEKAKIPNRTRRVSQTYTGYKIELMVVDELLDTENSLFKEMGGVEMDVTTQNKFAYLIGNFSNENSAKHFLENVIKGRYPNAEIRQYENGNRL
jgi:outer membrane protein OmpA-like peptidoglycan-associated protein